MDTTDLAAALRSKTQSLQQQLLAKVEANLSGDILQERSGSLKRSIAAEVEVSTGGVVATVASVGVPYAAIHEHGGRTSPNEIVPVKAAALAFAGAAGPGFARRVRHPGSAIPGRAYLGSALEAMRGEIESGLKGAVRDALCAS